MSTRRRNKDSRMRLEPREGRFPANEFEDELWRSGARESALARAHAHAYTIGVQSFDAARTLADRINQLGSSASVGEYGGNARFPWPVHVIADLPAWKASSYARRLQSLASLAGGEVADEEAPAKPQGMLP